LSGGERGLLGLAFHPQYSTNRRFFVYYTRPGDGAIQIAEYQTSAADPNVADALNERVIITIPHPTNSNHNGGTVAFGPDGYLYAGPGDGGSANDPPNNAQNVNVLLGKILRIDIDVPANQVPAYNIPPTNPYAGATPGADEIYAIGMRNPYRFSFDREGANQLWVADVGQGTREEVDIITNGGNFGWRIMEGSICNPAFNGGVCTPPAGNILPVFDYIHSGGRCSITGGYIYRGTQSTLPLGSYIYGDYCTGEIFLWNNNQQKLLLDTARNISSFGEDEAGELYVVGLGGTVEKIARNNVSVSGRVLTQDNRGLRNAIVRITDPQGGSRIVTTSSFGLYSFDNVQTLQTYTISVASKLYRFDSQGVTVSNTALANVNFVGQE